MHTQILSLSVEEVVQPMPWLIPAAFTTLLNVLPEAAIKATITAAAETDHDVQ